MYLKDKGRFDENLLIHNGKQISCDKSKTHIEFAFFTPTFNTYS